jgi:hypothetical protein
MERVPASSEGFACGPDFEDLRLLVGTTGVSVHRWLEALAVSRARDATPGDLILAWDLQVPHTGLVRLRPALWEHFVHHQDIRRPLGLRRRFRPTRCWPYSIWPRGGSGRLRAGGRPETRGVQGEGEVERKPRRELTPGTRGVGSGVSSAGLKRERGPHPSG